MAESGQREYTNLSRQEAIMLALRHSKVMQDLGGAGLRAPEGVATTFGPAVQETDVGVTEFEIGIRDLLSNTENAYWDLYYAPGRRGRLQAIRRGRRGVGGHQGER